MKILLVDDSLTIRSLLRRTLADLLPKAEVTEAPNGVEALAHIARRRFDLVVLDVNMPVMDGLETLEAIRASPEHTGLRVVMLTSEKNEALVRRLVELGITDFLSKPLSQEALAVRLSRILGRLQEPKPGELAPRPAGTSPGHRMLIVEQDPDRRHFLLNALAGHYELVEADSAASALQSCLAPGAGALDFVLVGPQVGLPPVEMFVRRLRAVPALAATRLIACGVRGEALSEKRRSLFDEYVELSHVPEVFLAELERVVSGRQTPLTRILLVRPSLAADVMRATEQVFGMMLSCEVEVTTGDTRHANRSTTRVHASIGLATEGDAVLTLHFAADIDSARAIAGRMIGVAPGEVQESDVLASAAELSNIVLGRLRNRLVEAGIHAQIQLPKTWSGESSVAEPQDDQHAIELAFCSPTLNAYFDFGLFARTVAPARA